MTRLSDELEHEALRLFQNGLTQREVGRLIGISKSAVGDVIVRDAARRFAPKQWNPSPTRLSMTDREEIRVGLKCGDSFTTIAASIGRAKANWGTVRRRHLPNWKISEDGVEMVRPPAAAIGTLTSPHHGRATRQRIASHQRHKPVESRMR
jgi:hypothetical protein